MSRRLIGCLSLVSQSVGYSAFQPHMYTKLPHRDKKLTKLAETNYMKGELKNN